MSEATDAPVAAAEAAAPPPRPPSLFLRRPDLEGLPPLDLPAGYVLRPYRDTDRDAVAALLAAAFPEMTWDADRVRAALLDDASVKTIFVIDHDGVPVATASARVLPEAYPGSGYVHWVGAHPDHRGARLGSTVSAAVLHEFSRRGLGDAVLETDDFRVPAIKTYLRLGFRPEMRHESHAPRWEALKPQLQGLL